MVCDSTFLIDRETNISPKLVELVSLLRDLVLEAGRKLIIFTEWTTMSYLIGKVLSELAIDFVEFSGKVAQEKRPLLIERFQTDPRCMAFLSTDAGGVGLNLQSADCVINFELPWNPARLNQRIGRVNRLGQKSSSINVVNLVCKNSIEERVLAGINVKQELFDAVLEGGAAEVELSQDRKTRLLNQVRELVGGEPQEVPSQAPRTPDLDERTPHFLNPEILQEREPVVNVAAEEFTEPVAVGAPAEQGSPAAAAQPADVAQLESVLNQGLAFLSSLSQMATGKGLAAASSKKAIEIDRETGEVVLRFKLPGF
jgi:superfamily II DNA or RNA helicase